MDQLISGIDVVTTNTKAILATPDGRVIAQDTQGFSLLTPRPGCVEQNPEEWWQATAQVTARLARQANVQRVQAVRVDRVYQPDPANRTIYDKLFGVYRA